MRLPDTVESETQLHVLLVDEARESHGRRYTAVSANQGFHRLCVTVLPGAGKGLALISKSAKNKMDGEVIKAGRKLIWGPGWGWGEWSRGVCISRHLLAALAVVCRNESKIPVWKSSPENSPWRRDRHSRLRCLLRSVNQTDQTVTCMVTGLYINAGGCGLWDVRWCMCVLCVIYWMITATPVSSIL